jgi:hypothetical protein
MNLKRRCSDESTATAPSDLFLTHSTILVVSEGDFASGELAYVELSRPRLYLTIVARAGYGVAEAGGCRQGFARPAGAAEGA